MGLHSKITWVYLQLVKKKWYLRSKKVSNILLSKFLIAVIYKYLKIHTVSILSEIKFNLKQLNYLLTYEKKNLRIHKETPKIILAMKMLSTSYWSSITTNSTFVFYVFKIITKLRGWNKFQKLTNNLYSHK